MSRKGRSDGEGSGVQGDGDRADRGGDSDDGGDDSDESGPEFAPIPVVPKAYTLREVLALVEECPQASLTPPRLRMFVNRALEVSARAQEALARPASADEL